MISEIISVVLQLAVFTLIPFIFFLFRKDKSITFSRYIGFYAPPSRAVVNSAIIVLVFLAGAIGVTYVDESVRAMVFDPRSVSGKFRLMGPSFSSIVLLLLIALFKTSLAEEILFRGFIAKRLISNLGFKTGNILQSMIFGLVHLVLFWALIGPKPIPLILIFGFSTMAGYIIGYIKEKQADGSIVPGWFAHGLGNVLSYSIIAFVL